MAAVSRNDYVLKEFVKHFPKDDFPLVKKSGKHAVFHFLLALIQPDESVLQWLKICSCSEKYRPYINRPDDTGQIYLGPSEKMQVHATGLTPLSLAILLGRRTVVRALCEHPEINIDAKDKAGWTPLQHAIARGDPEILEDVERATDAHQKTAANVTIAANERFPFLREVVKGGRIEPDQRAVRVQNHLGEVRMVSQKEFSELNDGAQFHDGLVGSPDALFRNWYRRELSYDLLLGMMRSKFEEFVRNRPKLFLTSVERGHFGVRTDGRIKQGEIATFCGSELTPIDAGPDENPITTGKRICNYGALVRDGFPNLGEFRTVIDGIEFSSLVALTDIKVDSELFQSYDFSHPSKWGPRTDPTLRQIREAFPRPTSPERLWKRLKEMDLDTKNPEVEFENQRSKAGLLYLFHTPSVLLSLIMQGHFDLNSIERLLSDVKFLRAMNFSDENGVRLVAFYRYAFDHFKRFIKVAPEAVQKHVASRLESNVRAAFLALQMVLLRRPSNWVSEFDGFCYCGEAVYSLLEKRGNQELSGEVLRKLSAEDRKELVFRSIRGNVFVFAHSAEEISTIQRGIL